MIGSFPGGATSSMVAKNLTRKLSQPFEELQWRNSEFKNWFGTTSSLVAKNLTKESSLPFEELQGSNLKFKLITPKPITGTYFDTKLSSFGLVCLTLVALYDIQMVIFQLFEELLG